MCVCSIRVFVTCHPQIEHISAQTDQLVETAMTTVQTMEANGMQYDADTVQIVKVTASVIAKLAPVLIQTAKEALSSQSSMESLNMISQEWATNVSVTQYTYNISLLHYQCAVLTG